MIALDPKELSLLEYQLGRETFELVREDFDVDKQAYNNTVSKKFVVEPLDNGEGM